MDTITGESTISESKQFTNRDLVNDFYLTFKLSEGLFTFQPAYYRYMAHYYQRNSLDYHDMLPQVAEMVKKIKPPQEHAVVKEDDIQWNIRAQWGVLERILKKPELADDSEENLIDKLIHHMCYADEKQMYKRGRRKKSNDRYESFFRTYVIGEKKIGSQCFDNLFVEMKKRILNLQTDSGNLTTIGMNRLADKWNYDHPGQNFFDLQHE